MKIKHILISAALLPVIACAQSGNAFSDKYLKVGKVIPNLQGVDQDGKQFNLSSYRGKVVVLDFFGFW